MNNQIKELRKTLKLTQQGFADRLGVKRNTVAQWELGINNLSEQVTRAICREFSVNEMWLRTGEGEMFVPKEEDALDELVKQYGLSDGDHILIEKFLKLKPLERQAVITYMQDVVVALNAETTPPVYSSTPVVVAKDETTTEPDIAAELAELKRQNQELAAKVAAMEEEERDEQLKADFGAALSALQSGLAGNTKKAKK